jgi:hypothetical protein
MLKNGEDWSVKNLELFKNAGFQVESMEEMQKIIDQNAADPDITKLTEDLALAQQEVQNQVMQEKQAEEEAAAAAAAALLPDNQLMVNLKQFKANNLINQHRDYRKKAEIKIFR